MIQPPKRHIAEVTEDEPYPLMKVYLWALSFLRPYLHLFFYLVMTTVLISTAELLIPKFIQLFIDKIIPNKNLHLFYQLITGLIGVFILVLAAVMLQNLIRRHLQEKSARDVQHSIFQHLR
ncbi:hypothetical protein [Paenibacillus eucommiae]|uniref:ABC-type bacteriocin/lantibiotic exporter with double-glycine peptidase domain n=1 Tax=Paenibacillus eucommiae TaxID=1355755 RepID=A0ABS4IS38_9BACL|nr:hypothetical protein [Paenibacillus eucommiae]MBP1989399.1 ABC-type bacteriocin/lantibiotic exporter with double-glycine peptidase domain [Paenibacillus eucommiae]